jgi:hypothetical protein
MSNIDIVTKLKELEERISKIENNQVTDDLKEVSLFKAARLLNRGAEFVISIIKAGKLPAAAEKVMTKKGRITRYRIRVQDIQEYQKTRTLPAEEKVSTGNTTDIIKQIIKDFPGENSKRKTRNKK